MNVGRHIIAAILGNTPELKRYIEAGFDLAWMADSRDLSQAAIFLEPVWKPATRRRVESKFDGRGA